MDFNLAGIKNVLNSVLSTAASLSPVANMLGIGKNITDLIATASEIGSNVLERVEDGTVIVKSNDKEELKALITKLEAANADLDAFIRNS